METKTLFQLHKEAKKTYGADSIVSHANAQTRIIKHLIFNKELQKQIIINSGSNSLTFPEDTWEIITDLMKK